MVRQPLIQPVEQNYDKEQTQIIRLTGKRRYVEKALLKMHQLASTLSVETITIRDKSISINLDINLRHNLQKQFTISIFRKDSLWVLSGDKDSCQQAKSEIEQYVNELK